MENLESITSSLPERERRVFTQILPSLLGERELSDYSDEEMSDLGFSIDAVLTLAWDFGVWREPFEKIKLLICESLRNRRKDRIQGIYVIVDPMVTGSRPVFDVATDALNGDVSVVQYRDKYNDRSVFLENAFALKELCDSSGAIFVVNDAVDVARLVGAPFLHVGQSDLQIKDARAILSSGQCVGRSNNGVVEAQESEGQGADYLAVGAVYSTSTMGKSGRTAVGASTLVRVKNETSVPVVAIGGIDASNISDVRGTGVDCACVVSAITLSSNVEKSARELVNIWRNG